MRHARANHAPPGVSARAGLPLATRPELLELAHGDVLQLRISPVVKRLGDTFVQMLGCNGSIPGPTLKVRQGSAVVVELVNDGDLEVAVEWHGPRLGNGHGGLPHETKIPVPAGGRFACHIRFPDPGLYWYRSHLREDDAKELGLYGNILVIPADPGYWPPANRDVVLTMKDLPLAGGETAQGSTVLVSGEPDHSLTAMICEVVRLWLTNTSSSQVFNVRLPGARMKLIGGDNGRTEHEEFVSEVTLAPFERAVVDVLFGQPGKLELQHRGPDGNRRLATITVMNVEAIPQLSRQFEVLRTAPELVAEREFIDAWYDVPPDMTLALIRGMDDLALSWQWPPHDSGRVKIRLVNTMDSGHTVYRPSHPPGAGRFLVLSRDGIPEPNLVWKDTVLIQTGQTVDILFEASGPGPA